MNISKLIKSHKNEVLSVGDIDIGRGDSSASDNDIGRDDSSTSDDDHSERCYLLRHEIRLMLHAYSRRSGGGSECPKEEA